MRFWKIISSALLNSTQQKGLSKVDLASLRFIIQLSAFGKVAGKSEHKLAVLKHPRKDLFNPPDQNSHWC